MTCRALGRFSAGVTGSDLGFKETTVAAVEMALGQPLIIAQSFLFLFLAPLFGLNDDSVVDSKH